MAEPKIYVASHRRTVGSAIVHTLLAQGVTPAQIVTRTHVELELTDQRVVRDFFAQERRASSWTPRGSMPWGGLPGWGWSRGWDWHIVRGLRLSV